MNASKHLRGRVWFVATAIVVGLSLLWLWHRDTGDPRLRAFTHARPPVPVVFTSRSNTASLAAAAPEGEVYTYPGQALWQADEGRLRLLTPAGGVHELTWGRSLPH